MDNISCVKREIEEIIKKSLVPEDLIRSKNTLEWLRKLRPNADDALIIATLGHDIERAIEERKIKQKNYNSYYEFKQAHALNSAKILVEIMNKFNISKKLVDDVFSLVSHHETGADKRADILRNADSISFFHVNLPYYFVRNGVEETKKRSLWGYRKLSDNLKKIVADFTYEDKEVESLLRGIISFSDPKDTDSGQDTGVLKNSTFE